MPGGANTMMVEPCSNQPISSPLRRRGVARDDVRAAVAQVQPYVEKLQTNARDQDGRHGHQGEQRARGRSRQRMTARSFLQNSRSTRLQRDGIHVPRVARDVRHLLHAAVVGRVKAVIHARGQPQRREPPAAVVAHQLIVAQQIRQRIRKALRLQHRSVLHPAAGAHQRIAGTRQHARDRRRSAAHRP